MSYLDCTIPIDSPWVLVPYLTNNEHNSYKITKIKGALTNVIYKLSIFDDGICTNYLVRIFGSKMNSLVDRDDELKNIQKVPEEVGSVKILLPFRNGRVEKFLDGFKSLSQREMVSEPFFKVIAHKFSILHFQSPKPDKSDIDRFKDGFAWTKIDQWISIIESPLTNDWLQRNNGYNLKSFVLSKDWSRFKKIITKYKEWVLSDYSNTNNSMVFCHNDTQQGNILVEKNTCYNQEPNIKFIDYEYSGPNFLAFDLSNFLTECMHDYNVDSTQSYRCLKSRYPSQKKILTFLSSYLCHKKDDKSEKTIRVEELKILYNQVIKWRGVTQLFWALWAILQSGELINPSTCNDMDQNDEYDAETLSSNLIEEDSNNHSNYSTSKVSNGINKNDDYFDYMNFCKDKLSFFWGDLIKFGIATKDDCIMEDVQYLDINLIP